MYAYVSRFFALRIILLSYVRMYIMYVYMYVSIQVYKYILCNIHEVFTYKSICACRLVNTIIFLLCIHVMYPVMYIGIP